MDIKHHFCLEKLERHLKSLGDMKLDVQDNSTARDIVIGLKNLEPITLQLVSEAVKLLKLALSMPVSVAESERSKTWLRSRMTQKRLTHAALLHIHKELLDDVGLRIVMAEFISKTQERRSVFGTL